MDLLRAKILEYIENFPGKAFIAVLLIGVMFIMVGIDAAKDFTPEQYDMAVDYLTYEAPDTELYTRLSYACEFAVECPSGDYQTYITIDADNYKEVLANINDYQYTMYVLSGFYESMMIEGDIGYYLYYKDTIFVDEISDLLRKINLDSMADAYDECIEPNSDIIKDFVSDVEELEGLYTGNCVQELDKKYDLSKFNKAFAKINKDDILLKSLAEYGRVNIKQFHLQKYDKLYLEGIIRSKNY